MVKLDDRRIAWWVREAAKGRERTSFWAKKWGVSTRHLQRLAKRYRDTGEVPTLNPKRRPKDPPLTAKQKQAIDQARQETHRGATKIYKHLRKQGVVVPKMKIHAYCRGKGWTTPNVRKQKKRSRCRYERMHAGSLMHGDWHQSSQEHDFVIAWLDDASRKVLYAEEQPAISAERSIASLDEARSQAASYGLVIREVNTDRGSEFYATARKDGRQGTSRFQAHLDGLGIRHIPSGKGNPQTNGKLERFWYEYDRHRWRFDTLQEFVDWYNEQIHDALWQELYENPREAFHRKLPQAVMLGAFFREVEQEPSPALEELYAT